MTTSPKIGVTILDDHQSIIDGYTFRLGNNPNIEVLAAVSYGEALEPILSEHQTDVLLLDVNVPASRENPNPYPILHTIPKLLQLYPGLNILVISMYAERGLIRAVMEAGASGYILKDDQAAIRDLGNIVLSVASGGIYFSHRAHQIFLKHQLSQSGDSLSPRQLEALSLCATYPDRTTNELAKEMSISNSTIRNLLSGAYIKLGVRTRAAAITKAREAGIITPNAPTLTM